MKKPWNQNLSDEQTNSLINPNTEDSILDNRYLLNNILRSIWNILKLKWPSVHSHPLLHLRNCFNYILKQAKKGLRYNQSCNESTKSTKFICIKMKTNWKVGVAAFPPCLVWFMKYANVKYVACQKSISLLINSPTCMTTLPTLINYFCC